MSRVRKAGPLAPFADGFAAVLRAQGYTSHGAVKHRHLFASLSRWLEREKLAPVDLNEEVLGRFSRSGELLGGETYRASGLLSRYWRTFAGSAWSGLPARPWCRGPVDDLLGDYVRHLVVERGLLAKPARGYAVNVRPFL